MTWKDYQLKIQLAKTPQEFQKALAECVLALLKAEEMRSRGVQRQGALKDLSKGIVSKWLSEQMKCLKKS